MLCRRSDELLQRQMLLVMRVPPQELVALLVHLYHRLYELHLYGNMRNRYDCVEVLFPCSYQYDLHAKQQCDHIHDHRRQQLVELPYLILDCQTTLLVD